MMGNVEQAAEDMRVQAIRYDCRSLAQEIDAIFQPLHCIALSQTHRSGKEWGGDYR